MATEASQTMKDVVEKTVEHHKRFLEEYIDPDTGLLDILLGNGTLSKREYIHIKNFKTFIDKNSELLNCILKKHQCDRLVRALRETEQKHIVNYLNENGEYKPDIGGDWPLTEKEVSILNINQRSLVDLLECDELLGLLFSSKVINKRQRESISSKPTSHEKNEALLECLQRRSLRDYFQTIKCLHKTKQSHIAEILEEGGAVVRVHANLVGENVTEAENEISTAIANMIINDRSSEEANRILELVNLKVIAAKTGQCIVLYIYCKTIEELQLLQKSLTLGRLKNSVELWFNRLLIRSQKITMTALTISTEEFQKMQTYFKDYIKVRAIVDFDPKQMLSEDKSELKRILQLPRGRRLRKVTSEYWYSNPTALIFKRGDQMMTIHPAKIGDSVGWWMVKHLNSGKTGYIPRNRVVIDVAEEDQPVKTTIDMLPLELLDIILHKSFLHYALSGKHLTDKRYDEFLVNRLSSVDFCWFQRLRKHRFREAIWRHVSKFYKELYRGIVVLKKKRSYLDENIQPKVLISQLRSADCLTDVETRLLNRQTLIQSTKKLFRKNNNPDLLHVMRSFDDAKLSDFIHCLYKSNQKLITRVAVFGGVLIKAIIFDQDTAKRQSLVQTINDLRSKTKPRSHQMEKLNQLKDHNIEILNSFLDRQTVVWIWCHSQTGLEKIQKLNESNSLIDVFTCLTTPPSSSSEITKPKAVSICRDQFKRCVEDPYLVVGSLTNDEIKNRIQNFYTKFVSDVEPDLLRDWLVQGNVITPDQWQTIRKDNPTTQSRCDALLQYLFSVPHPAAFLVVWQALSEENHPILKYIDNQEPGLQSELRYKLDPVLVQTIRTKVAEEEKKAIRGMTILDKELFVVSEKSSEVEVYDSTKLIFTRQLNLKELFNPMDIGSCNRNKCLYIFHFKSSEILKIDPNGKLIKKWSTGGDLGFGLSVTDESNVILTVYSKNKLNEYSSDGQLIREIILSSDAGIRHPWHAIKLTSGHFLVSHGFYGEDLHRVCIVDRDGKLKKSFGEKRGSTIGQMYRPYYLAVDENGFVMVADQMNSRVLLLDSALNFEREILSKEKHGLLEPKRILLDTFCGRLLVTGSEWHNEIQQNVEGLILNFAIN